MLKQAISLKYRGEKLWENIYSVASFGAHICAIYKYSNGQYWYSRLVGHKQPSAYHLTIYRYANIVWFSKYRWNIVIVFFLLYPWINHHRPLVITDPLRASLDNNFTRAHPHLWRDMLSKNIVLWRSSSARELFPGGRAVEVVLL